MPRGGARSRSGPQPAEHSREKDRAESRAAAGKPRLIDDGEWMTLPREGRTANPPAWPLTKASKREQALWRALWKKPQGMAWEALGQQYTVAVHVRTLARAEVDDSAIGLLNLVRLQQDGLGLTAVGLNMLKWRIAKGGARASADQAPTPARPTPGMSVKDRLKLVTAGG